MDMYFVREAEEKKSPKLLFDLRKGVKKPLRIFSFEWLSNGECRCSKSNESTHKKVMNEKGKMLKEDFYDFKPANPPMKKEKDKQGNEIEVIDKSKLPSEILHLSITGDLADKCYFQLFEDGLSGKSPKKRFFVKEEIKGQWFFNELTEVAPGYDSSEVFAYNDYHCGKGYFLKKDIITIQFVSGNSKGISIKISKNKDNSQQGAQPTGGQK